MRFADPSWLWGIPILVLLGFFLWHWEVRMLRLRLVRFIGPRSAQKLLDPGRVRSRRHSLVVAVAAMVALLIALARPLGGLNPQAAKRRGINVLIALDGSRSMLVKDVAPSRFALAQAGIGDLLSRLAEDRAAMMFFGGQATLVAPLTFDTVSLQYVAGAMDPELAGKGGTSIAEVVRRAAEYFRRIPGQAKVLVVFSDGEETDGDAVLAAQAAAQKDGLRIFTVGVGTPAGGPVPVLRRGIQGEVIEAGVVHDASGREVVSRLDEHLLQNVARVGGGAYVNLAEARGGLAALYEQKLAPLAAPMEEAPLSDYTDHYQWPVALALVLLLWDAWRLQRATRGALRPAGRGRLAPAAAAVGIGCFLLLQHARGSPQEAQKLLAQRQVDSAFLVLQADLLAHPDDSLARYNYAVGAYAAGKYSAAIEMLEKLGDCGVATVESRSRLQIGNCYYRIGEAMRGANPEGALTLWEKALAAYEKAPELPAAVGNYSKAREDAFTLLRKLAQQKIDEGDEEARTSAEKGLPAWKAAITHLDRGTKLVRSEAESRELSETREAVVGRIYQAHMTLGGRDRRQADLQHDHALERAVDLMDHAVAHFGDALAARQGDATAEAARAEASARLEPWLIELGDQFHQKGFEARELSLDDAIAFWQKAASSYARVLERNPASGSAKERQSRNNQALHDGYEELGDYKVKRAGEVADSPADRDALLEQALDAYQDALRYDPKNGRTREKMLGVGRQLTEVFVARGFLELATGKKWMDKKLADAIAAVERSVQSFNRALQFDPGHAEARAGKAEAEELLKKLRELDARNQRKVMGKGKDLKDPKEIEDASNLDLKLMDFKTDRLASKKQQNFTAPENKPVKDW